VDNGDDVFSFFEVAVFFLAIKFTRCVPWSFRRAKSSRRFFRAALGDQLFQRLPRPPLKFTAAWPGKPDAIYSDVAEYGQDIINVGVAEWKVARAPGQLRTTLGSCVGVVLYSAQHRAGGLAHILLGDPPAGKIVHRGKYARTAVESLVNDLTRLKINPGDLEASLLGGASLFDSLHTPFLNQIGPGNIQATRATLGRMGIRIIREDVGGKTGRTITVNLNDGSIELRMGGERKII
jgi:chemotaxis protein CheD